MINIRPTKQQDIGSLRTVLDETELFPSEMLPDMLSSYFGEAESQEIWLTCEISGDAIGFCYAAPEALTDGTWNMLAIAVSPTKQGTGFGGRIVEALETNLRRKGQRILLADTSGNAEFAQTREFYKKLGYKAEARIEDFWAEGDDKITFRKSL